MAGASIPRTLFLSTVTVLIALAATGCGGSGRDDSGALGGGSASKDVSKARAASFPRPLNRSLRELVGHMTQGPQLAPSVSVLTPGTNRFGFGLFDRGNHQIGDLDVALYVARGVDETAHGPYPARYELLQVRSQFRSKTAAQDPDAARSVYVANIRFPRAGAYLAVAVAKLDQGLVATSPAQVMVVSSTKIPGPGDKAIRVHTPTVASVGGDLKKIDTRVPPDDMHKVDLADALDRHRPILLLFATPALCQSRVCGPVTDVAEQVKFEFSGRVDFIHMEIYNDNDLRKGLRAQVRAWHLKTEPFAFAIDRRGVVVERLEGAFDAQELTAAVRKALR